MKSWSLNPAIGGALCAVALLCTACDDFSRFKRGKPEYYARLSAECDSLLPRGPVRGMLEERIFAQETNSLPPMIRQLSPSYIQIVDNTVLLMVGSYTIIWRQGEDDDQLWKLFA